MSKIVIYHRVLAMKEQMRDALKYVEKYFDNIGDIR